MTGRAASVDAEALLRALERDGRLEPAEASALYLMLSRGKRPAAAVRDLGDVYTWRATNREALEDWAADYLSEHPPMAPVLAALLGLTDDELARWDDGEQVRIDWRAAAERVMTAARADALPGVVAFEFGGRWWLET